jgi:hypothetical protein
MEPEDFEDYIQDAEKEIIEKMIREKEKQFSEGCVEGYNLLKEHGTEAIKGTEPEEAKEALNRMMGYFIQMEEYEKCSDIQKVYKKAFKQQTEPIFPKFLA